MTAFRIRAAVTPFVLAAAVLASASATAAPVVSFAQGLPNAAHPCAQESGAGLNDQKGLCQVPAAVSQARATWLANVAAPSFEEFERTESRQLGAPALFAGEATMTLDSGAFGSGFYSNPLAGTTFLGRFNTTNGGGSTGWWFEFANGSATIRFASPVEAFGFYLTDLGDDGGGATASVSLFNGQAAIPGGTGLAVAGREAPLTTNGSILFFGVTSDGNPFDRVTLSVSPSSNGSNDFVGLDSLIIGNVGTGTPLPAPGTLALAGLALLGLRRLHAKR
jgi:hypothetical protein